MKVHALVKAGAAAGILATAGPAQAVNINFDYSYDSNNFFSSQQRKDTLNAAADYYVPLLDDLQRIEPGETFNEGTPQEFSNEWTASFNNPATGATEAVSDPTIPADTLRIYAGGRDLSSTTLGKGGPGGYSSSGTTGWNERVATRGEDNADASNSNPTDFGPWGGSVTFDNTSTWNFDAATGPSSGENDFLSVAIHELGHVFGYGASYSDENFTTSFQNYISNGQFTGPASTGEYGGGVPLDEELSHWQEGIMSETLAGLSQEVAMDPTLSTGTRKILTNLDYAGLRDIGWETIPEPATLALLGLGATLLLPRRRRSH